MESQNYFEVNFDHTIVDAWFLNEPRTAEGTEIDARVFIDGVPYWGPAPARLPIFKEGRALNFHLASFDMPVVSLPVSEILREMAFDDIELFPVSVDGHQGAYFVLNVVHSAACLDLTKSDVLWWQPEDGRPDKVGGYRQVADLTIDPSRVPGHNIFRLLGWEISLIVSQRVRDALIALPDLGVLFKPVTPDEQSKGE
jgi:hypothetical protein